jgi:hypothetical protein
MLALLASLGEGSKNKTNRSDKEMQRNRMITQQCGLVTRIVTFRKPAAAQSCYTAHINYHMREYACKLWHIFLEGKKERNVSKKDGK